MKPDFFYAKHLHKLKAIKLKAYIIELQNKTEEFELNNCFFQQWLNQFVEGEKLAGLKDIIVLNKKYHTRIKDIIELKEQGKYQKALNEYKNVEKISKEMLSLLNLIETSYTEFTNNKTKD